MLRPLVSLAALLLALVQTAEELCPPPRKRRRWWPALLALPLLATLCGPPDVPPPLPPTTGTEPPRIVCVMVGGLPVLSADPDAGDGRTVESLATPDRFQLGERLHVAWGEPRKYPPHELARVGELLGVPIFTHPSEPGMLLLPREDCTWQRFRWELTLQPRG